jgi:YihY family inner membrane protein
MPTEVRDANRRTSAGRWGRARAVIHEALVNFFRENSLTVSASIAYHGLLALFPFMLLLLGLSGFYIRRFELAGRLVSVMERYVPVKVGFLMQNLVGISRAYGRIGLVSFVLLLWSSSGVFLPLERALNRAWEVEEQRSWWRRRLLALEMAVIVGFLAVISTTLVGVNVYIHEAVRHAVPHPALPLAEFGYDLLVIGATFGMTLGMFIVLFERLPNRSMRWRQVFPSALLTAVFWEAARSMFTLLLRLFNYHQVYGEIGVIVALMTWVYISSAVTLFGAQVSRVLYRTLRVTAPPGAAQASSPVGPAANAP